MNHYRRLFYVVVPLLSSLLTIFFAELTLALFAPVPYAVESNMYFTSDPHTGQRLMPHGVGYYADGIVANANSRGHRDEEIQVPKPANTIRILVLGDSFTVGANVRRSEAYPQVLESWLDERELRRVEVVNTGVGGWSPYQYAEYFEHYGAALEPDVVLVGFFVGNDTYIDRHTAERLPGAVMGRRISAEARRRYRTPFLVFFHERSHLVRRLKGNTAAWPERLRRRHCGEFTESYLRVQRRRLENHLPWNPARAAAAARNVAHIVRIREQTAAKGIPMMVIVLPDENQINPLLQDEIVGAANEIEYDLDMPQKMLHQMFEEENIRAIDLLDLFRSDSRCLYMNDTHWTAEGHALVAGTIRDALVESGVVNANRKHGSLRTTVPPRENSRVEREH